MVEHPRETLQLDVTRPGIEGGKLAKLLGNALERRSAAAQSIRLPPHHLLPVSIGF